MSTGSMSDTTHPAQTSSTPSSCFLLTAQTSVQARSTRSSTTTKFSGNPVAQAVVALDLAAHPPAQDSRVAAPRPEHHSNCSVRASLARFSIHQRKALSTITRTRQWTAATSMRSATGISSRPTPTWHWATLSSLAKVITATTKPALIKAATIAIVLRGLTPISS